MPQKKNEEGRDLSTSGLMTRKKISTEAQRALGHTIIGTMGYKQHDDLLSFGTIDQVLLLLVKQGSQLLPKDITYAWPEPPK